MRRFRTKNIFPRLSIERYKSVLGPYGPRGQKTNGVAGHNTGGLSYNAANILVPNDGPVRAGVRSRCDLTMLRDWTYEHAASASAIHWHPSRPGEREN